MGHKQGGDPFKKGRCSTAGYGIEENIIAYEINLFYPVSRGIFSVALASKYDIFHFSKTFVDLLVSTPYDDIVSGIDFGHTQFRTRLSASLRACQSI